MKPKKVFAVQSLLLALVVGAIAVSAREDDTDRNTPLSQPRSQPPPQLQPPLQPKLPPPGGKNPSQDKGQGQAEPLAPLSSAFTYQGRLKDGTSPANGQYDLQFALYDADAGGNQVGSTVEFLNQTVTDGLFTVPLDFGPGAFQGEERWLEMAVRPTGGSYTTLSPRQALAAAPYAMSLMPGSVTTGTLTQPLLTMTNTEGVGIYGTSTRLDSFGVYGRSTNGEYGAGLYGISPALNGNGVIGDAHNGPAAAGVWGRSNPGLAVWGQSQTGTGVFGSSSSGYGVRGTVFTGTGVHGSSADGTGYGVRGVNTSSTGWGVLGTNNTNSADARGVVGHSISGVGTYGLTSIGTGVVGYSTSITQGVGVYGYSSASNGRGVYGEASGNGGVATGVYGTTPDGYGGWFTSDLGFGVVARGGGLYAGYFIGNVLVEGNLYKGGGAFKIDHPLDPANKYLSHSFVESPDMMNVYNGNVTLDAKGEATVTLPDWFEALNKEFRYQLTTVGGFAPVYIAEKVQGNRFKIAGGKAGLEVSWQVTGIRKDAYAEKHRIPVEEVKPQEERGKYLHPTEYGQPESKGIDYERIRQMEQTQPEEQSPRPPNPGRNR